MNFLKILSYVYWAGGVGFCIGGYMKNDISLSAMGLACFAYSESKYNEFKIKKLEAKIKELG